ncbi:DegV family protein [Paenibacillus sp.]|uniref:DegV family protein n=1 Tax=Paenibacillus sp. TaxID=58172 RepID=UPI002D5D5409|nr:DegV family protein [Paenibacillus sp.]HZG55465.1 DegV family protein [Paenibacillus sp.]
MATHIITDGSSDLPEALRAAWDIRVVPLGVRFGEEQFDSTMKHSEFYDRMRASDALPQTSSPSPHAFMEAYRQVPEGDDILVLALSSQVSSTYQHAMLAREMLREERSGGGEIEVIDSRTASMGLGGIAYKAAKLAKSGVPFAVVAQEARRLVRETRTHFVLDTLENVIRGGRLDKMRGAVASMLNIKLLMHANEQGAIEVLEKARGSANAVRRLVDRIEDAKGETAGQLLAVAHSRCEERAEALVRAILERFPFAEVVVSDMGPVIGTYAGEGGLLISYERS